MLSNCRVRLTLACVFALVLQAVCLVCQHVSGGPGGTHYVLLSSTNNHCFATWCRPFAEKYLADQEAFFQDYVAAHLKLSELGVRGLRGGPTKLASSRKARLVEYAMAARVVTADDLDLLP